MPMQGRRWLTPKGGSPDSELLPRVAAAGWSLQQPLSWARVRTYLVWTGVPAEQGCHEDGGHGGAMRWQGEKPVWRNCGGQRGVSGAVGDPSRQLVPGN